MSHELEGCTICHVYVFGVFRGDILEYKVGAALYLLLNEIGWVGVIELGRKGECIIFLIIVFLLAMVRRFHYPCEQFLVDQDSILQWPQKLHGNHIE